MNYFHHKLLHKTLSSNTLLHKTLSSNTLPHKTLLRSKLLCKTSLLLCTVLLLTHCSCQPQEAPQVLKPYDNSQLNYNVSPASNTYAFPFYSSESWTAVIACSSNATETSEPPSVFPASGSGSRTLQSVNFTLPENNSEQRQTYYLTIVSKEKNLTIVISQRADLGTLEVTPTEILLPSFGGSKTLRVTSNKDWSTVVENPWFTLSQTSGRGNDEADVTLSADHNKTTYRTSAILFQSEEITSQVTVSQHAFYCTLPATTTLSHEGPHTLHFTITSSLPWTLTSNTGNWLTMETTSHDASQITIDNLLTITPNTENSRTAKLTLLNSNNEKQIFTITQTADITSLFQTHWTGTATVEASGISQTGAMDLTIVDENSILVRGYPGQISHLTNQSIAFRVLINELTYNGITGYNIIAHFTGNFSEDQSILSGTLSGTATVLGMSVSAAGTWRVLHSM